MELGCSTSWYPTSEEAILACQPDLSTEWLGWVAIVCALWRIRFWFWQRKEKSNPTKPQKVGRVRTGRILEIFHTGWHYLLRIRTCARRYSFGYPRARCRSVSTSALSPGVHRRSARRGASLCTCADFHRSTPTSWSFCYTPNQSTGLVSFLATQTQTCSLRRFGYSPSWCWSLAYLNLCNAGGRMKRISLPWPRDSTIRHGISSCRAPAAEGIRHLRGHGEKKRWQIETGESLSPDKEVTICTEKGDWRCSF